MGLLDDPLGTLFGNSDKEINIDRRNERMPEGKRWWEIWDQTYQGDGDLNAGNVLQQAYNALDMAPMTLSFGGQKLPVYSRGAQRQASSYLGLLNPWLAGGEMLETGRIGDTTYMPETDGLLADITRSIATGIGQGVGSGVGAGASRKFIG